MDRASSKPLDRDRAPTVRTPVHAPRRARARTRPRATGPDRDTRALVIARDGGKCVRCGKPATNVHHRSGRGMGGRKGAESDRINQPAWLLSVCGSGNVDGCHGWIEGNRGQAEAAGYRVPRNSTLDAEGVPVLTATGWARFLNDGTVTPCPPPAH